MQTIGFTNKYYTLWEVSPVYEERVSEFEYYEKQDFTYIKNLSTDLETAKSKLVGDFDIDLDLCGASNFTRSSKKLNDAPVNVFCFGKYCGKDIIETNDVNYTDWYYQQTKNKVAKQLLIDNGFVEYNNDVISEEAYQKIQYDLQRENYLNSLANGHHFENGKRLSLELKEIDSFSFDGYYGTTFVIKYASKCGKIFKYVGSNPADISRDEFEDVTATIKHDNYNGENETKLQRIKHSKINY